MNVTNIADARKRKQQRTNLSADLNYVPEQYEIISNVNSGLSYTTPTAIDSAAIPFGSYDVNSRFGVAA